MKRFLIAAVIGLNLLLVGTVLADQNLETDRIKKQLIKIKCSRIKIQVEKVRHNDSLTRVNYGQAYESIIKGVMVPINARLITNRFGDKTDLLVKYSNQFSDQLDDFRKEYNDYQKQIDKLARIDCQQATDDFYCQLILTQDKRAQINQKVADLKKQYQLYQQTFQEVTDGK